ncbi:MULTISPECIES: hypothetical protein [Stenotrophomonas]|uniref:hypothetical protein n=1 Tax=Stenotrophomonas TaxID=40323 RepID=UPI0012FDF60B|nr:MULTISPECIES: hypothetical protein [Stenotrophomonas]MBN5140940.1 hypothetical protein [Stenotrophomonas maltophilia]
MAAAFRYTRRTLPAELADMEAWPPFDFSALDPEDLVVWNRRRAALACYLAGDSVAQIKGRYGYQCHQIVLFLNRCLQTMQDGRLVGCMGLVKGIRTKPNVRARPVRSMPHLSHGGYAGALEQTFSVCPSIRVALEKYLATGISPAGKDQGRVTPRTAHQVFLKLCTEAGFAPSDWPFCVERQGRVSLDRYVHRFFADNHQRVALLQFGEISRDRSKRGTSPLAKMRVKAPFEAVEADEHEAHIIFSVGIQTPKGMRYVPCRRLSLIVVVDRYTSHILAWNLVVRRQPSSADFLECIDGAIGGQCLSAEAREALLPHGGDHRRDGIRVGFDTLFVDNALSHLSDSVCARIREAAGASVSFGALRRPKRRSLVERVFSWMAREVFHRSRATTGNNPVDTRRFHPESAAVRLKISMEDIMRGIDKAVGLWNNKPTEANYGCSPAQQLLDYFSSTKGALPPLCPSRDSMSLPLRLEICRPTVRGSQAKGRLPYITYASVEYSSQKLAARWELVGKKIRIHADPNDISVVQAYTAEGESLDELMPISSRWQHPHSREIRRLLKAKIKSAHDMLDQHPAQVFLIGQEQSALEANEKSVRVTRAASIVAEEARKGYSSEQSQITRSTRESTRQLVRRIRKPTTIDFSVIGKT